MLVSTTILKFATGSSSNTTSSVTSPSSSSISGSLNNNLLTWDCDKYSAVKLESPDTNLDDILLDQTGSSDFAELKPLSFDEFGAVTILTGSADPVLSAHNNNFTLSNKCSLSDLSNDSPSPSLQFSSSSCSQSDVTSSGSPNSPSGASMVAKIEALDFSKVKRYKSYFLVGLAIEMFKKYFTKPRIV